MRILYRFPVNGKSWEPPGAAAAEWEVNAGQRADSSSRSRPARRIKARMEELGRDPGKFRMRLHLDPVFLNGKPDLDATLAQAPMLLEAGATDVDIFVAAFCNEHEDFEPFIDRYTSVQSEYR
jgi:hypothetical protein